MNETYNKEELRCSKEYEGLSIWQRRKIPQQHQQTQTQRST